MAAVATATTHLHDPFAPHHTTHFSPAETSALLDLLAVDHLIDARTAASSPDNVLLNDLLAVDLEFARVDAREHTNVATAPAMKDEKDLLLDLLKTDQEVDGAKGSAALSPERHYATTTALHDPYAKKEHTAIEQFTGLYAAANSGSGEHELRDNVVMMHLLAMDESVDGSKRYQQLIASDDYAIIGELYEVDKEVSGAKRRALLVEDLQGLLDVDHLVDGKKKHDVSDGSASGGGKRSIFSVKEKYTAKVAAKSIF